MALYRITIAIGIIASLLAAMPFAPALEQLEEHIKNQNFSEAQVLLTALNDSFPDNYTLAEKAVTIKVLQQKYPEALTFMDTATVLQDSTTVKTPYLYNLEGWVHFKTGNSKQAEQCYLTALQDSTNLSLKYKVKIHNNLGMLYLDTDNLKKSKAHFTVAEKLGSSYAAKQLVKVAQLEAAYTTDTTHQ